MFISKSKKLLKSSKYLVISFPILLLLASCNSEKTRDVKGIKALAESHVKELDAPQLLQEFILSIDNDTVGACYSMVMPKQTLMRLMQRETYPTPGGLEKIRENLVKRYVYGIEYVDSCINDKKEDKDWLINNTVNEPVNPIWEQIIKE